jgi:hypothetical protein
MWNLGRGRGGQQSLWKHFHSQNGHGNLIHFPSNSDSPSNLADKFAEVFSSNFTKDDGINFLPSNRRNTYAKIDSIAVTPHMVFQVLHNMRASAAISPDRISARILHDFAAALSPSLSALFSLSLSLGVVSVD